MTSSTPGSSSSRNPSDQQRSQRHAPSHTRRTLLSHTTSYDHQGASPDTTNIVPRRRPHEEMGTQDDGGGSERGTDRNREERSSPSVSSSQGDMADTEMEPGPSQSSDTPQPTNSPPKKKRTRTLTTPHQSAVLHALLAQSRFPTTAMREEVGKSIGLSARKVQIWFQNQRQKARRPRGQAAAPLTRPPQFGPFSNAPPSSFAGAAGVISGSGQSLQGGGTAESHSLLGRGLGVPSSSTLDMRYEDAQVFQNYPRPTSSFLSGPGIPGSSGEPLTRYSLPQSDSLGRPVSQEYARLPASYHTVDTVPPRFVSRPTTADDSLRNYHMSTRHALPTLNDSREHRRNAPIILPPLVIDPARGPIRTSGSSQHSPAAPLPSTGTSTSLVDLRGRTRASDQPFAYQPPLVIPPPFTLEPRPQWDDAAFSPFSRPGSASLSRLGSAYGAAPRSEAIEPTRAPSDAGHSPVSGRNDRLRGADDHSRVPSYSRIQVYGAPSTSSQNTVPEFDATQTNSHSFDNDTINEQEDPNR